MNKDLDYNLLKVLMLLYRYRNLKKVSLVLGKSEGTISKYLSKLRLQIGDPLFVRTLTGLEPTPTLVSLLPKIEEGLDIIDSTVFSKNLFSPSNYRKTIRIAIHSSIISHYSTRMYTEIRNVFDNSQVSIELWNDSTEQKILDGKIHIGVHFMHEERKKQIYQSKLISSPLIGAVSSSSSICSWDEFILSEHVLFKVNEEHHWKQYFIFNCLQAGIELDYAVITDDFETAISLVRNENMAVVGIPTLLKLDGLKLIDIPKEFQAEMSLVSCIDLVNRNNPLHVKLIKLLNEIIIL